MKNKKNALIRGCILAVVIYYIIIICFYYIAGEQLYFRDSKNQIVSANIEYAIGEITKETKASQEFICNMDRLDAYSVSFGTYERGNVGSIEVKLFDLTNNTIADQKKLDVSKLQNCGYAYLRLDQSIDNVYGHRFRIEMTSENSVKGSAVTPMYSASIIMEDGGLTYNGEEVRGTLCFNTYGKDNVWTGPRYFKITGALGALLCIYCIVLVIKKKNNKKSITLNSIEILKKYKFLIKQLVLRDFKIKYKRSLLGALWSLINPLLTMSIQYIIFSTIFKADIVNYPIYLLSGVILFNFFTEATGAAMYAIVGNASLITKVYVPKYIYPVSKIFSSAVNLIIAIIPLIVMCIWTSTKITIAYLLVPFTLVCLVIFCIGIGFVLSSLIVFFRDIQFIWGVVSMAWMYATPIFYPESILPMGFDIVLKINPLFYFIKFFRIVVINGISPEPILYLQCMLFALATLVIGICIFRKTQNKFIYYI
jgi:ABC-2 type transport system permease protein